MNWRNPFLTGYLAVTVVGAGILGYLVYSSYSQFTEVSEQYDTQVAKLQSLQNRRPYPSAENNAAYAKLTDEYRAEYDKLLAQVAKMQKPLDATLTPQTFQDRLRAYVSEVESAAKQNGVTLPPNFYLGFSQYQGSLPSNEAAPPLGRELDAIRLIVNRLIELKVAEIKDIQRAPLAEEGGSRSASATGPGGRRSAESETTRVISTNTFEIGFVADQPRVKSALNAIATAEQFFVIRNLTIENSSPEGPKRAEDTPDGAPAGTAANTPPPANNDSLGDLMKNGNAAAANGSTGQKMRLLVGRESLVVSAHIEMLTFTPPTTARK